MPSISKRAAAMPASPIRKLVPFADAAKARGVKIYHLNIGQPDLETPPEFWQAIFENHGKILEYSHSAGLISYRTKLAAYYDRFNMNVRPNDLLITTGGSEAIRLAIGACLDIGDEIIAPEPLYANYLGFAAESNVVLKTIGTSIENNFELPAADAFAALITPKTKALLICNPSNPTGKLYSRDELRQLADIALKNDLYLIADEVYKEFCYDGEIFTSILQFHDLKEQALVVDSVSKRYSACGARIGCLITKNETVMAAALKFAQARLSPPTLGQLGAEALCDLPETYYKEVAHKYVARRDFVYAKLAEMPGVFCPRVSGAFYLMPQLPIDDSDRFCQWLLESFSYEGETLMLAPATGFYVTPGEGKNQVRLAYVLKESDLERALNCLKEALKVYPGRTN